MKCHVLTSLKDVDATSWNNCTQGNPFVSHGFLSALEDSGCAVPETGWAAQHIVLKNQDGHIVGVMPLYLKSHSYGEYVFDHGWAEAYERAGGQYYPKLQSSVPFSPVTGPRLMGGDEAIQRKLLESAVEHAQNLGVSSLHITFLPPDEEKIIRSDLLTRQDKQFHWINEGYEDFDDFLATLTSRKRKTIRKERREALRDNIEIEILQGAEIQEYHWDHYFDFYQDTSKRKWGQAYLNRQFFSLLGERLKDNIVLMMCKRDGRYIAGALNLTGPDCLYGRYWGCLEDHRFLHFEVCYYRAIDYAIQHKFKTIEAGAQGEHKLARGYVPTRTLSAHWIADPGFRAAVSDFLERERVAVDHDMEYLQNFTPFRK